RLSSPVEASDGASDCSAALSSDPVFVTATLAGAPFSALEIDGADVELCAEKQEATHGRRASANVLRNRAMPKVFVGEMRALMEIPERRQGTRLAAPRQP